MTNDDAERRLAARALARGAPLEAMGFVGRDESPLGLALRGIAYAQMGDYELARTCLARASASARATGDRLVAARAQAALVEVSLQTGAPPGDVARDAAAAAKALEALGDGRNGAMQRLVLARAEVLRGRLGEARRVVESVVAGDLPPDVLAIAWLARAEIAIRAVAATAARDALEAARTCLARAPNAAMLRAVDALEAELAQPLARLLHAGVVRAASLLDIEAAATGELLFVDACRGLLAAGRVSVPLARRPVLLALALELARAFPASVARDTLAARAFETRLVNASHRARLRVEIGRLRATMDGLGAAPVATADGYALASARDVTVLLAATDDGAARIALLLTDGAAWSAQSLAEHAGVSLRTAQRALADLVAQGFATSAGRGRARSYTRPGAPIASRMLLLGLVPAP